MNIIDLLVEFEKFKPQAYKDHHGYSIGYGHLIKNNEKYLLKKVLTEKEARDLLFKDLNISKVELRRVIKIPLSSNQETGLLSLLFNVGLTKLMKSGIVDLVNHGKLEAAAAAFLKLNKGLAALDYRRQVERDIFLYGKYPTSFNR